MVRKGRVSTGRFGTGRVSTGRFGTGIPFKRLGPEELSLSQEQSVIESEKHYSLIV